MPYDVNKLATLNHLKSLAERVKSEISGAIEALPTEMFLDQTKTGFIPNFMYNATTYAGSEDPNLNGKPVLVLAVKGADNTVTYSFLDMSTLVDTYSPASGDSEKILTTSGYQIAVNVSKAANNALTVQNDGLHVDISGKADRVTNATNDNLSALDANGNPTDSGIKKADILQTANIALDSEASEMIDEVFGA